MVTNSLEGKVNEMSEKYIITSAQYGASVNYNFLDSLETMSKEYNAEIIILPMKGRSIEDTELHVDLQCYKVINNNFKLNDKIRISEYEINPQMIIPVTGLARLTQSDVSTIFASPKQMMKVVPNSNEKLPKVLMTTGAVTNAYYRDNRIGRIAALDHRYGALIVETDGRSGYHYRQLQSLKNGTMVDLGRKYRGKDKPVFTRPEAMVLGDIHVGDTNKSVMKETYEMFSKYKPKRVFLHDLFNGVSVNHHNDGKVATLAKNNKNLNLLSEMRVVSNALEDIVRHLPNDTEVVVVRSNHDEWVEKYIESGNFLKEPQNTKFGAELLLELINGHNLLEYGIKQFYNNDRVKFLSADEDYKVLGWQLGNHGHYGANGGRGSIRSIEFANGKSITGHSHTPQIFRNAFVVGTSTNLKLDYNKGYSGWMNTHGMLYDNGKVQLVNIIKGKHRG